MIKELDNVLYGQDGSETASLIIYYLSVLSVCLSVYLLTYQLSNLQTRMPFEPVTLLLGILQTYLHMCKKSNPLCKKCPSMSILCNSQRLETI